MTSNEPLDREREYYEKLYSGFAQSHFAKPAVVAFRRHLVDRIVRLTHADRSTRVLSLGSGTGDTELLLAPLVGSVVGIDISPRGVEHANQSGHATGISNAEFLVTDDSNPQLGAFDLIIAIFFLHHLPARIDSDLPRRIFELLKPGGYFYALDPSRYRLSGAVGRLLIPGLMRRYQTEGEEPLSPTDTWDAFERAGFTVERSYYDFVSTPLAGLFPSWRFGYRLSRAADELLIRLSGVRQVSSNFEVIARKPVTSAART